MTKQKRGEKTESEYCAKSRPPRDYCAHGRTYDGNNTCYNKFELLLIAETIEKKEQRGRLYFRRDGTLRALWKDISAYMKSAHDCTDELCWVETLKMAKVERRAFKPKLPKEWLQCDPRNVPNNNCMNSWLSNYDLNHVMTQFAANVPDFAFLGSVPIDFDTSHTASTRDINRFSVREALAQGKTKIGVIFNTQPSHMGGEHWMCAFIDLSPQSPEINFFDSYGTHKKKTYPEIDAFLQQVQTEAREAAGLELVVKKNTVRHQFQNSECGVYCLKFIADRLGTKTFEDIIQSNMPDHVVVQERYKRFFRVKQCRPTSSS